MGERLPTKMEVMESNSVHTITKDILIMSEGKDPVDAYHDVLLAAKVLKREMMVALGEIKDSDLNSFESKPPLRYTLEDYADMVDDVECVCWWAG